ncbi:MAG: hypothetical protein U0936_25960, partial [Planctomycetaceae bacterium]
MVARCLLIGLFTLTSHLQAEDITLSKDGDTDYVIVTPAKPSPEEVTAAEWLSAALKQVTKADFKIV